MQLPIRVRAKTGVLVPVPCQQCQHGGVAMYVGRDVDHEAHRRGEEDNDVLYPPKKDATEYSMKQHGHAVLTEIQRAVREGALLVELKAPAASSLVDTTTSDPSAARKKA